MEGKLSRKLHRSCPFAENEDINPMHYTGNLADAMLVLAVGIMLALIMAYKVDLRTEPGSASSREEDTDLIAVSSEEDYELINGSELEKYGVVYQDKEGNLYVVEGGR